MNELEKSWEFSELEGTGAREVSESIGGGVEGLGVRMGLESIGGCKSGELAGWDASAASSQGPWHTLYAQLPF